MWKCQKSKCLKSTHGNRYTLNGHTNISVVGNRVATLPKGTKLQKE